jgi:hypothetical protein
MRRWFVTAKAALTLVAASAALLFTAGLGCRGEHAVRIGSKNFTEQVVLGEMAAQALEAEGVRVDRRLDLGGTFVCHRALLAGELDLYPEYTGTAFTAILARKPIADPARVRTEVAQEYARRFGLVWTAPLGFENTFALVMRSAQARELSITKISDLARYGDRLRPGFGYEFVERADGFRGLAAAYGLKFAAPVWTWSALRRARPGEGRRRGGKLDGRPDRRSAPDRARRRPPLLSAVRGRVRRAVGGLEDPGRAAGSRAARRRDLGRRDASDERRRGPRQAPARGRGARVPRGASTLRSFDPLRFQGFSATLCAREIPCPA